MSISFPGRARIDPTAPEALGICDRCGLQYSLRDLRQQVQWAGTTLINTGLLVCTHTCYDVPSEFLRTLRLPPDPPPVYNTRVENFAADEHNDISLIGPVGRAMFQAFATIVTAPTISVGLLVVTVPQSIETEAGDALETEDGETITVEEDGFPAYANIFADLEVT